jgi:GNAT superfamily N-acetyltransferase
MDWYNRLSEYFPNHELKPRGQMQDLLTHHEAYKKWESDEVLATYAEFHDFIFIDYLLVNPKTRGKGIGTQVLNQFKNKNKTVILEVEPPEDYGEDSDITRRIRFYERNGFHKADHIEYTRSDDDGMPFSMDLYYWSPNEITEKAILNQMAAVCREIHNFRSLKYYGRVIADPDDVLNWNTKPH